jgi:hypothetical protein
MLGAIDDRARTTRSVIGAAWVRSPACASGSTAAFGHRWVDDERRAPRADHLVP